jgi:hypothetical protein
MRFAERSASPMFKGLAEGIFVIVNILLAIIVIGTLKLLVQGRLFPKASAPIASVKAV